MLISKRWGAMVVAATLAAGCVTASEGDRMRQDIDALKAQQQTTLASFQEKEAQMAETLAEARGELAELRRMVAETTERLQKSGANVGADLEEMRREVELLRGKLEESEFKNAKLEQDLKLYKEDVELRFAGGGSREELPQEANALLAYANEKIAQKDFRNARRALERFTTGFPEDRRVDDVLYLLAETFFLEGQWVSAIFEYQKILKRFPKSAKKADATFRIGESFFNLGKCKEAQVFFEAVRKSYAGSPRSGEAKGFLTKLAEGGCP